MIMSVMFFGCGYAKCYVFGPEFKVTMCHTVQFKVARYVYVVIPTKISKPFAQTSVCPRGCLDVTMLFCSLTPDPIPGEISHTA